MIFELPIYVSWMTFLAFWTDENMVLLCRTLTDGNVCGRQHLSYYYKLLTEERLAT